MPTTTNYGWTTPADTDLVKDGAAAIRTLGSSIDTSVKSLNAGTTAGDLDYYTSATTKARIGIGTNGQVLISNGSTPSWGTPTAGGMTLISETTASALSSLSLSSIPQTYKQLMLVWNGIYHSAASNGFGIRLNSASTGYYCKAIGISGTTFTYQYTATTDITASPSNSIDPFGNNITGTNDLIIQANGFFLIDNYASTTKVKTYNYDFGFYNGANKGLQGTGVFGSTSAVTSIDVFRRTGAGTFSNDTNTSIRLYGIS